MPTPTGSPSFCVEITFIMIFSNSNSWQIAHIMPSSLQHIIAKYLAVEKYTYQKIDAKWIIANFSDREICKFNTLLGKPMYVQASNFNEPAWRAAVKPQGHRAYAKRKSQFHINFYNSWIQLYLPHMYNLAGTS